MDINIISKTADNKCGKINIYPRVEGDRSEVVIIGDPDGLRYLARLLNTLADFDQDITDAPTGSREHTHLVPETHLGYYSTPVEICRADAKGTGALPEFFDFSS